jgi:hypothetical protein
VSTVSDPSRIGVRTPGSQIQIVRPMAVRSEILVSAGTSSVWTARPRNRPTISTTIEPPTVAISGDSSL